MFDRMRPLLWLLPLVLAACENRVTQCNALIDRLNPHTHAMIDGVEALSHIESDPEPLSGLRTVIDKADQELASLSLRDETLAGFAQSYRRQLSDARSAAESMASAAASKDAAGLNAAAKRADAFLDAQATIVEELNAYCSASSG